MAAIGLTNKCLDHWPTMYTRFNIERARFNSQRTSVCYDPAPDALGGKPPERIGRTLEAPIPSRIPLSE